MKKARARSPLRLGFGGGGTDLLEYSKKYGGQVLNATINLYAHCQIESNAENQISFSAIDFGVSENVALGTDFTACGELKLHKAVYIYFIQKYNLSVQIPLKVITYADVPRGSGAGTSSALVVALISCFAKFFNLFFSKYEIAKLAYVIEREICGFSGGMQDQYASAFGGFNFIEFNGNKVVVNPLRIESPTSIELESKILLYYTGQSRESSNIIDEQIKATSHQNSNELNAMHEIRESAVNMKNALLLHDVTAFFEMLAKSWKSKKRTANCISNPYIDTLVDTCFKSGAEAVKISGAGGGGFMMIAVSIENRFRLISSLGQANGRLYPFSFVSGGVESWMEH